MKNISVLIKPASGACNMTCDYCFYCDEAAKREQKFYGMMSEETLKNMIRRTMLHSEGSCIFRLLLTLQEQRKVRGVQTLHRFLPTEYYKQGRLFLPPEDPDIF